MERAGRFGSGLLNGSSGPVMDHRVARATMRGVTRRKEQGVLLRPSNASRAMTPQCYETSPQRHLRCGQNPTFFRFTAAPSPEMQMQNIDNPSSVQQRGHDADSGTSETAPILVGVFNRGSRTSHRNTATRHSTRASNREFNFTSGNKRKFQFPEFFDISNVGNGRDRDNFGGGGGKRARFV
jgi:hypothetical protein